MPEKTTSSRVLATTAALALAAFLSGCGSTSHQTTTPTTKTTSATTSPPTTVATTQPAAVATTTPATAAPTTVAPTTVASTTTTAAGPTACTSAHIGVTLGSGGAGVGHEGIPLLFRNTGAVACVLQGYPGVVLLNAAGHRAAVAEHTPSGYLGGLTSGTTPPALTVGAGETVSALLEGTDNPDGSATSCPTYPAVLVTPPDQTTAVKLTLARGSSTVGFPGCSPPQVHPVVSGRTGSPS